MSSLEWIERAFGAAELKVLNTRPSFGQSFPPSPVHGALELASPDAFCVWYVRLSASGRHRCSVLRTGPASLDCVHIPPGVGVHVTAYIAGTMFDMPSMFSRCHVAPDGVLERKGYFARSKLKGSGYQLFLTKAVSPTPKVAVRRIGGVSARELRSESPIAQMFNWSDLGVGGEAPVHFGRSDGAVRLPAASLYGNIYDVPGFFPAGYRRSIELNPRNYVPPSYSLVEAVMSARITGQSDDYASGVRITPAVDMTVKVNGPTVYDIKVDPWDFVCAYLLDKNASDSLPMPLVTRMNLY